MPVRHHRDEEFVVVADYARAHQAQCVHAALVDAGIASFVSGEHMTQLGHLGAHAKTQVHVPRQDIDVARRIVMDLEATISGAEVSLSDRVAGCRRVALLSLVFCVAVPFALLFIITVAGKKMSRTDRNCWWQSVLLAMVASGFWWWMLFT